MKALLAQLDVCSHEPQVNAERAAGLLREHSQADLAVFPELFLSGYALRDLRGLARACAAELPRVCEAAAATRTAVAIGLPQEYAGGVANAVALIDEHGSVVGLYQKRQLFGSEQVAFAAGERLLVAELAGCRAAPLVCFDVEFPELARAVAVAGAEMLVVVSANMAPFGPDHELLTRARALENRLPLVYVNGVGAEDGVVFAGGSRVVDADGSTLVELPTVGEAVVMAEVPARTGHADERVDYLRHLLPTPGVVGATGSTAGSASSASVALNRSPRAARTSAPARPPSPAPASAGSWAPRRFA